MRDVDPIATEKNAGSPQRAEDFYRTLIELSPDAIAIHQGGRLIFVNNAGLELFHAADREEVIGRSVLDFVHPDDRAGVAARMSAMVATGKPVPRLEERFLTLDGQVLYGEATAAPFTYEGGSAILVVVRDVTERHRTEEERKQRLSDELAARMAAEEAQRRLAFVAEAGKLLSSSLDYETTLDQVAHLAVPDIADWCVVDVIGDDGSIRRVASAHVDPEKEAWARELTRRYPPDERSTAYVLQRAGRSLLIANYSDEILAGAARDEEHLGLLKQVGFVSSMSVALEAHGKLLGSMTFISTNPSRRYAEPDLELAEELATHGSLAIENSQLYSQSIRVAAEREAMLGQMAEGVAVLDATGKIIFVNKAAEHMAGESRPGATLEEVIQPFGVLTLEGEPHPPGDLPLGRALRGETVTGYRWRIRGAGGREVVLEGSGAPLLAEDGTPLGAVSTFRDITAEFEVERQKNEFLSLVAHEIRTPVTVIQGFIQLMERYYRDDSGPLSRHLDAVARQVKQIGALVNDLLALSRLQRGALTAESRPLDLVEVVRGVVEEMRMLYPDRAIEVESPEAVPVLADVARLHQVLMNLLDNALTYGPSDGLVSVRIERDDERVVVAIADGGPPIPEAERERLFERFYRMPAHRQSRPNGLGIGLYISRAIVEAHGGRMWVPDADHAEFAFSLPA